MPPEHAGEFARIQAIVAALPRGEGVVLGPGDDAAVLRPSAGHDLVVTTDTFVEGVHWRRGLLPPRAVGRRLAAANLSDLAAMAAVPRWAVVACAAPRGADAGEMREVERACASALAADGATIVGGNLSATAGPPWWCVTLVGEVARGRHWTRSGARPGDVLAVTGHPGRAAAALAAATRGAGAAARAPGSFARVPRALVAAYAAPRSRVRAAQAMAGVGGVRAAIDLSDGITGDLAHLCEASRVGAVLDAGAWTRDALLEGVARALSGGRRASVAMVARAAERLRFAPSDDYELLLAVAPDRFAAVAAAARGAGATLTSIGRVERRPGLRFLRPGGGESPLPGRGHDHFG